MEAKPTTLTELEERLAAADGGVVRTQLLRDLAELEARFALRLAQLVPKVEHQQLAASIDAVRAARKVLQDWVPGTGQVSGRLQ